MGTQASKCISQTKSTIDTTQEKVMSILCFCREKGKNASSQNYRYGSLASGGKYDDSDEEDSKGMLYNNNLLLDDDDDEEEQIVIITRDKTNAKPE